MMNKINTILKRNLFGIQPSGNIHIGHIQVINNSLLSNLKSKFLVADLHSRTSSAKRDIISSSKQLICQLLALNVPKSSIYIQSNIKQIGDLLWYISHFIKLPQLTRMHLFKQLESNNETMYISEFCYPALMLVDILLSDCNNIFIGEDQEQHIELYNDFIDTIKIGNRVTYESIKCLIGTDGRKMSKSYNNTLSFFEDDKTIKNKIMNITTANVPLRTRENRDGPFFDIVKYSFTGIIGKYLYSRKNLYRVSFLEEKKLFLHFFLQKSRYVRKSFVDYYDNWNNESSSFINIKAQENCYKWIKIMQKILNLYNY